MFGVAFPFLQGAQAEIIGGGEVSLGEAGDAAYGAHIQLQRHIGRDVGIGGDLAGEVGVGHGVQPRLVHRLKRGLGCGAQDGVT